MNKVTLLGMSALIGIFATGCASVISKKDYNIAINTAPSNAEVSIIDEDGIIVYKGKSPTNITLEAGGPYFKAYDYTVTVEKEGYDKQIIQLNSSIDPWYFANILFGGAGIIGGGLIIDPLTGSMWKLPDNRSFFLQKKQAVTAKK